MYKRYLTSSSGLPSPTSALSSEGTIMMNTTVNNLTSSAVTSSPTSTNSPKEVQFSLPIRVTLIIIYTVVLLVGITGLTLMMSLLKTNIRSLTTIAFLNLIVAHFLFLFTVPFRIYYYATQSWHLGNVVCKLVSAMVHIHMHMVFIIYTILLTVRFLQFFKKMQRTEFYRRLHALGASALLWFLIFLIMLPLVIYQYGNQVNDQPTNNTCFKFHKELNKDGVYALNMIMSLFVIIVSCVQICAQALVLRAMLLKYGAASRSQQEFWVQIKNLSFVLIMLICLVPYHLFRLQYLNNTVALNEVNEVFLGITGLACIDMLTFTGKNVFKVCWR